MVFIKWLMIAVSVGLMMGGFVNDKHTFFTRKREDQSVFEFVLEKLSWNAGVKRCNVVQSNEINASDEDLKRKEMALYHPPIGSCLLLYYLQNICRFEA